jgi:hypothetical protein
MVRLFHPRRDRWSDHFHWQGAIAWGLTPVGRVTIEVLAMNHSDDVAIRLELITTGKFPPTADVTP